jgi:hypothetical protein
VLLLLTNSTISILVSSESWKVDVRLTNFGFSLKSSSVSIDDTLVVSSGLSTAVDMMNIDWSVRLASHGKKSPNRVVGGGESFETCQPPISPSEAYFVATYRIPVNKRGLHLALRLHDKEFRTMQNYLS